MTPSNTSISDQVLAADIARVAAGLRVASLSRSAYFQHGKFSQYDIYDGGRTWEQLCTLAGVSCMKNEPVPDEVYFQRLASAISALGRLPKASERKQFGLNFSKRRYPNLSAFLDTAIELGFVDPNLRVRPLTAPAVSSRDSPTTAGSSTQRPVPPIPRQTKRTKWERTGVPGFPYAPQDELGVVALFAVLCSSGAIGWEILEMRGGKGIDVTCFDHAMKRELRVELKFQLSRGSWNHKVEDLDYVVCWENRWLDFPKPVVVLRDVVAANRSDVA